MLLESIIPKMLIVKGGSYDQKYGAVIADGPKYLLRISTVDRFERKQRAFGHMRQVAD